MVDFRVSVVLPAGGCGSRMGMDIPKQYFTILGRPLISYTMEAFEHISWIQNVIVAGPAIERQQKILDNIVLEFDHRKVITTSGGSTRHRSIFNAIQYLNTCDKKPDVVVIHDAVRPFIEEDVLKNIVNAAWRYGACGAVRPLVSTVVSRGQDGFIDHSLDRSKYIASEMPQAFQYDVILNAYQKCTEDEFEYGTECLQLALTHSQTRAFLLDGPQYLWKVTYKKDLFAAEGVIKARFRQCVKFMDGSYDLELTKGTEREFSAKGVQVLHSDGDVLCKTNILVKFELQRQDQLKDKCSDRITNELVKKLDHIRKNGILIIVRTGCDEDLAELKVATRQIAREAEGKWITCCAVWCENFVASPLTQNTNLDMVNSIAKMTVTVALETSPSFSGQVFSALDPN